jgi:hypothetical protein
MGHALHHPPIKSRINLGACVLPAAGYLRDIHD